ncbi:hypothetical protein [Streptomyces sp. DW26H14]|uniref:hypothetical protein n=1 Tax=Streptomyces sp. DW26H14 TaxID=3435395 RepID=UPI00403D662B
MHDAPFTYTEWDLDTGLPLGTAEMELDAVVSLNASSAKFTETNYISMVGGDLPLLLTNVTGDCSSACTAGSTTGETSAALTLGSTVSGVTTFTDNPAQGAKDETTPELSILQAAPGDIPLDPAVDSGVPVRCDTGLIKTNAKVPSTSTGCVHDLFKPTVTFSLAQTGSTVAIDDWAIETVNPAWGQAEPLERISDEKVRDANRAAICDSTFVGQYADDSCEEYPFASTTQSGGWNGLTGEQCAQVEAVNDGGGNWVINTEVPPTGKEGCVRGHADTTSQNSQGGVLSTFVQQNRMIADDEYYISITA